MEKEFIEKFIFAFVLLGLIIEAFIDIREKKVWLPVLVFEFPVLLGLNYWIGKGDILLWVASAGTGIFFYLVSIVTREQIGKGDALVFAMTGAGLGLWNNLLLIYITFILAALVSIVLWGIRHVGRKYTIPLVPFVLFSYLIVLIQKA